ncbi:hypothetical protein [Sphingomonas sp. TZW2008]|uniref:hypothetical protein n=1 Tax=Sphingomonas sp. TZW2008 TaxID=1917973 RepID=UPI000A2721E8|nr:hypothetical protein [Sphingomonas sp. TZW2008]
MSETTHLYGTADPENHQAAQENGMRGEAASEAAFPALRHTVSPPGQPSFEVEETSGIAAVAPPPRPSQPAHATERQPQPQSQLTPQPVHVAAATTPLPDAAGAVAASPWPWIVVSAGLAYLLGRRRGRRAAEVTIAPRRPADDLADARF